MKWQKVVGERNRYTAQGKYQYVIDISRKEDLYYLERGGEKCIDETGEVKLFYFLKEVKAFALQWEPIGISDDIQERVNRAKVESLDSGTESDLSVSDLSKSEQSLRSKQPSKENQSEQNSKIEQDSIKGVEGVTRSGRKKLTDREKFERSRDAEAQGMLKDAEKAENDVVAISSTGRIFTKMEAYAELFFSVVPSDLSRLTREFCTICQKTFITDFNNSAWDDCPRQDLHQGILKNKVVDDARTGHWTRERKIAALRAVDKKLGLVNVTILERATDLILTGYKIVESKDPVKTDGLRPGFSPFAGCPFPDVDQVVSEYQDPDQEIGEDLDQERGEDGNRLVTTKKLEVIDESKKENRNGTY